MTRYAFAKFKPGQNRGLRRFEIFFRIPARDGERAWTSGYRSVQNLLDYLARYSKSEDSREVYLNILRRFCEWTRLGPDQLVKLRKKAIEVRIQRYVDIMNREDRSRRYINTIIKRLRTFYQVNGMSDLDVHQLHVPTRYRSKLEYIPTKSDIYSMVDAASSPRDRAVILCFFSSGLRMSTFRAINFGDIRQELEEHPMCVQIVVEPYLKERVHGACKGGIPYYTFFCKEAVDALNIYLRERTETYGPHRDDDPLFSSQWRLYDKRDRPKTRLSHVHINRILKDSARRAGIEKWSSISAQTIRKSFESVLRSNTLDGGRLDKGTQEFFFGHILPGSQDVYYDRTDIGFHRTEYMKLDFGRPRETRLSDILMTTLRMATDIDGDPDDIIRKYLQTQYQGTIPYDQLSDDRRIAVMSDAIEWWRSEHKVKKDPEQVDRVIHPSEIESYLEQGYSYVTALNDEKVIVRKATHMKNPSRTGSN